MLNSLYWYCTDFCVNMANLLGISYEEFNFWLFVVVMPGLLGVLMAGNVVRYLAKPIVKKLI